VVSSAIKVRVNQTGLFLSNSSVLSRSSVISIEASFQLHLYCVRRSGKFFCPKENLGLTRVSVKPNLQVSGKRPESQPERGNAKMFSFSISFRIPYLFPVAHKIEKPIFENVKSANTLSGYRVSKHRKARDSLSYRSPGRESCVLIFCLGGILNHFRPIEKIEANTRV